MTSDTTEAHKRACLARYVASLGERAPAFLASWADRHGEESAESLRQAARAAWRERRGEK